MTEQQVRDLLLRTVENKAITATRGYGDDSSPSNSSSWPVVRIPACTEMPTEDENLCCGKQSDHCLSRLAVSFLRLICFFLKLYNKQFFTAFGIYTISSIWVTYNNDYVSCIRFALRFFFCLVCIT